jgi:hypothetical protein
MYRIIQLDGKAPQNLKYNLYYTGVFSIKFEETIEPELKIYNEGTEVVDTVVLER